MARFLVTVLALSALIALAMGADNTTTAAGSANQTPKPTDPPRTNASTTSTTQNTTASSANQTPKPTDPPVTSQATPKPTDPPRTNASTTSNTQNTTAVSNPSGIVQNTTAPASANQTPKPTDPPVTSQATPKPTDPPRTNASTTSNTQNTTAASNPSGSGTFQNTTAPASANQTPKPTDPPVTSQATPKPTDPPRTDASSGVQNTTKPTDPPRTDLPTVPATTAPQSVPTTKLPTDAPRSDAPNTTKPTDPPRTAFPTDPTTGNRTDPPRTDGPSSGNKTDAPRTAFPTDPTTGNRTDPPRTAFPTDPTTGNKTDLPRTDRPEGNKTDLPFTTSLRPSGNGTNGSRTDRPQPTDTQTAPRTDIPRTDLPDNRTDAPRNRTDMPFTNVPRTDKPAPVTRPPCSPNLTLTVGGTYTFSSSQVARVYLGLADGALCGLTPIVMWKVGTLAVQGSVFTSQLPAGTYQGSVSVTLGTSATSASTQASFTIVVTSPPATIQIRGGDRQVAVGSSITFVAAATSAKSVSWSCCVYGDNGACASATCTFTSSMLDSSFVGTLATGFPTAGKYVVTATSDAQVSATVNVLAISTATQVNTVQLQTGASSSVYVGTTITIVAQAADGSKYAWTATDGSTSGNAVANFKPSTTGTFNVTVTATSKAGVVGAASLSFTVMPLPTGTLTVTSTDSPIVGGTSSLTLTLSQWTGPSTATFRFGYLQYGQWNALSDDFGTTTTQTYTAPLVVVDRSIVFAVQALMGKQRLDPITAAVTVTAPVNKTAAVAERQAAMNAAAAAKDISTVLRAALDVADASTPSTSTTGSATAGSNSATTISSASSAAVAAVASVVTTTMSSTQKGAAIDVLASALNSTGTDSVKTDANTQKEVVQCLAAVLSGANTSAATSTDAVDTSTRAAAMLALIGTVNATAMANDTSNRDARQQLARNLALTVAAQLSVGQTTTVQSSDMNITAAKVPVSASQPTAVSTPQASISIPLAALASAMNAPSGVVGQSGTTVAVSATSHATNPVPTAKTPSGSNISSAIVEFDVTASGASFSSLSSPITIRLQANATKDGKPPACVYFDATSNTWSTAGLVTTDYNATDKTVGCNTTHLSMFAATVSADAGATSSTTSSPSSPASSGTDNTGIYAAVGICVGVLFIAGVVIVRRRQTAEAARHPTEEPLNGMGQLQVPMQQQPQRPVAYDPYNRV